jgi:hypothetical protein
MTSATSRMAGVKRAAEAAIFDWMPNAVPPAAGLAQQTAGFLAQTDLIETKVQRPTIFWK